MNATSTNEDAMAVTELNELLKHELGDLLYAEKTVLKGLKKMSKEVSDPALRERMLQHYDETEQQIANLEQAFETIGAKPRAQKCAGILGLMEEHDEFKSEEEPSKEMLEAFDLGSGLRIEHYEIAAYNTAIALAKSLRNSECAALLTENLRQEVEMEKFLRSNAARALKALQTQAA
jgi:ferritin-like metal-binding protein YciE